jgi:phosphoribosylanthranilate isomerase
VTRIKICGLTREVDVDAAVAAGVDALGFNFAMGPRRIAPERGRVLARRVPPLVHRVGLFVDADRETVLQSMRVSGCEVVQLHGDEPPALAEQLRAEYPVIKAWRVRDAAALAQAATYPCDLLLLDAWVPGAAGGTGQAFDHGLLRDWECARPVMLAGGMRPDTVAEAVRAVRPFAVDCASGVESSPGCKDPALLRAFVQAVREEDRHG